MSRLSEFLIFVFIFFLFPMWAGEVTGNFVIMWSVAAAELALIVLAALLPIWLSSATGRLSSAVGRTVAAVVTIAVLNFILNCIWPLKI